MPRSAPRSPCGRIMGNRPWAAARQPPRDHVHMDQPQPMAVAHGNSASAARDWTTTGTECVHSCIPAGRHRHCCIQSTGPRRDCGEFERGLGTGAWARDGETGVTRRHGGGRAGGVRGRRLTARAGGGTGAARSWWPRAGRSSAGRSPVSGPGRCDCVVAGGGGTT